MNLFINPNPSINLPTSDGGLVEVALVGNAPPNQYEPGNPIVGYVLGSGEPVTIDKHGFAIPWKNKHVFLGGNQAGMTQEIEVSAKEFVFEEMRQERRESKVSMHYLLNNFAILKQAFDHRVAVILDASAKHEQLQQFTNTSLGVPLTLGAKDPYAHGNHHPTDSQIQNDLRMLGRACRVCGERPGIWVTARYEYRDWSVLFECHGETEVRIIPEEQLRQSGFDYLDSIIPFSDKAPVKVVKAPVKRPSITLCGQRTITLDD